MLFVAPDVADLVPLFPGYEVQALIATGGMGAVYRALQKSLDRAVAIKILPHEFGNDAGFRASFEAEAKAMARLNHPNLVGVYDFGEVNGMLYIIMEFVEGQSLFHSANQRALDARVVVNLVAGICDGLEHAHRNGILHRDIKPSNILLDCNGNPKIGDFGLARPIGRKAGADERVFGTPDYTAPEVIAAPHAVDYRADIFSVGVVLHELLTGRLPAADPRPPSAIVGCDPRFNAIVRRATSPQPGGRYASAAHLAKDLRAITNAARLPAPRRRVARVPFVKRPYSESSRRPSGALIGSVIGAVAIVAAVAYHQLSQRTPPQKGASLDPSHPARQVETPPAPVTPSAPQPPPRPPSARVTEPAPVPEPAPKQPEVAAQPKFDVPAFFTRARKIMQERAAPIFANRDKRLARNLTEFDFAVAALVRKIESRTQQDQAKDNLKSFMSEVRQNGNRLPATLNPALEELDGMLALHEQFMANQGSIDSSLAQEVRGLVPTYVLGIQKQIERLNADHDTAASTLLTEEIERTRTDADYFPNLILASDPHSPRLVDKTDTGASGAAGGSSGIASNSLPLLIGGSSDGASRFKGEIAHVVVAPRAFSDQELLKLADPANVSAKLKSIPVKKATVVESYDALVGKAYRMDGEAYLEVANSTAFDASGGITLAAWIRPSEFPGTAMRIIDKCPPATAQGFVLDIYPGNSLRLITRDPHFGYDAKLPSNRWTHVAATVDGKTGRQKIFINGKLVARN